MNEDRQKIWDEYKGVKTEPLRRMFLDYNRYFEANLIAEELERWDEKPEGLKVLDYGCGVGDYAMTFARKGAHVDYLDADPNAIAFLIYRLQREGLQSFLNDEPDLVIFGEVLDHLKHPYDTLRSYVNKGARFIFTSSYPYRSDDPNESHWQHDHHPKTALAEQPACRQLLEDFFIKANFGGQRNLWIKK